MRDLKKHNEPYGVQLRTGTGAYKGKDGSLMSVVCVFRLGTRAIVKEEVMVRWKMWEMIEEGSDNLSVIGWGSDKGTRWRCWGGIEATVMWDLEGFAEYCKDM